MSENAGLDFWLKTWVAAAGVGRSMQNSYAGVGQQQALGSNMDQQLGQQQLLGAQQNLLNKAEAQIDALYGEQCADTDGMMVEKLLPDFCVIEQQAARIVELEGTVKAMEAEHERQWQQIYQLLGDRDALRAQLAQRMALPSRALKFSR